MVNTQFRALFAASALLAVCSFATSANADYMLLDATSGEGGGIGQTTLDTAVCGMQMENSVIAAAVAEPPKTCIVRKKDCIVPPPPAPLTPGPGVADQCQDSDNAAPGRAPSYPGYRCDTAANPNKYVKVDGVYCFVCVIDGKETGRGDGKNPGNLKKDKDDSCAKFYCMNRCGLKNTKGIKVE
ncbi:MAG: hypothetical protein ACK502_04935 [Alphaproteobacteria bacterium]